MVERSDDIDDDWGSGDNDPDGRPRALAANDDESSDAKVDTAKNRLARINERVRVDSTDDAEPPSRPLESRTVPPPSGYEEVRRTSKRQAFDLDAALERRALRQGNVPTPDITGPPPASSSSPFMSNGGLPPPDLTPMPPISPAPPSSSAFFAAGRLPPRPQTLPPTALVDDVGPPRRPLAPIIAAALVAFVVVIGIAAYAIALMRPTPQPATLASATVAPTHSGAPPPTSTTTEPIVPAVIDTAPERVPQPTAPAPLPSPRTTAAPPSTTTPTTPTPPPTTPTPSAPPPPAPKPAPAPAHAPTSTGTAAPGVEFLKRNL